MKQRLLLAVAVGALGMAVAAAPGFSQTPRFTTETKLPYQGPGAKPGYPGWYLQGSPADPEGPLSLSAMFTDRGGLATTTYGRAMLGTPAGGRRGGGGAPAADAGGAEADAAAAPRPAAGGGRGPSLNPPGCRGSAICLMDYTQMGGVPDGIQRVIWKPTMGYTFSYPLALPAGGGNVAAASVDSHDNIWVYQRNTGNTPSLLKFGQDNKLLLSVDPALTNGRPFRAHDMKVDADDNVWAVDEGGAIVQKFSPDGKLLQTIGTKGKRGDWDEAKGQRLLWEPVAIDFGPNGDIYIFSSHADESPNDVDNPDPANHLGVARVIRLDKTGKFISQWFGSTSGAGKFYMGHGGAVDPVTGDVWVGDRQNYRIVIFNADGYFLRTISMRNLTSALFFDKRKGPTFGQAYLIDGQDGQVLKLDHDGDVMGAIGTRKGTAPNHFSEGAFMGVTSKGVFYVGDSQVPRVTVLTPPTSR